LGQADGAIGLGNNDPLNNKFETSNLGSKIHSTNYIGEALSEIGEILFGEIEDYYFLQ